MCSAAKKQQVILCCAWNTGEERVAPLICFYGVGGGAFSKLLVYPSRGNFVRMLDPEVSYGAEIAM